MVYKYKRKTNQAQWSEDIMMLAIADCNSGIPVKTTARKYGLPYATLYRHWKKGSSTAQLGRFRKVFNDEEEGDLRTYLFEMDSVFYGLTRDDFKVLVYEYAKRNKVTYPTSWDKHQKAGNDWLAGFLRRNPQITLRIPEATSIGRVKGFNRPQVERFYKLLSEQIERHQIDGTRIYNVDETGVQTSTNKPPKVLSVRGKKQVGVISSTERGQTTTIVCCCNAAGAFVPPFMIFARKRMQDRLLDGSPPETRGSCSASGWINGEIFLDWLKFFVGQVRPSKEKKVILLLDNHESHKYYPALEYATENNVIILSLPPHTSNKLQPLDVAVYGPLKIFFEQEINKFQKAHPGRIINQYDVAKLFSPAYLRSATPNNAIKGFQSSGIWPTNQDVWEEADYAPSATTMADRNTADQQETVIDSSRQDVAFTIDIERPSTSGLQSKSQQDAAICNSSTDCSSDDDLELFGPTQTEFIQNVDIEVEDAVDNSNVDIASASDKRQIHSRDVSPSILVEIADKDPLTCDVVVVTDNTQKKSGHRTPISTEDTNEGEVMIQESTTINDPEPSTARPSVYFSPKDVRPLPMPHVPMGTRKRKIQKSEILTSTPIKQEQKEKFIKISAKAMKDMNKDLKPKTATKKNTKTIKKLTDRKKDKNIGKENEKEQYVCYFCGEYYIEINKRPVDDWIQCDKCKQWSHEKCTAYEGIGLFICDICTD